jgi:hypothetical protein
MGKRVVWGDFNYATRIAAEYFKVSGVGRTLVRQVITHRNPGTSNRFSKVFYSAHQGAPYLYGLRVTG